ncbi:MAG: aminoglycoside phosphotransferase family protein [Pseudomonadota bacterium]
MDKSSQILSYIVGKGWLSGDLHCTFLAAGEYNENYRVSGKLGEYVFRINHGTQLGLAKQVEYEFTVLQAVFPSGVTPKPMRYSLDGADLGQGVLLMEYLPGRPLEYARDLDVAARIFARIHVLPPDSRLIVQADPLMAIAAESLDLIGRYNGKEYREVRKLLLQYHDGLLKLSGSSSFFADENLCMVNTEVNSGNFLIHPERSCLIDWEKAVTSCRYQDLAHFLVPTTTLWKTDCRLSKEDKRGFLVSYRKALSIDIPLEELIVKTSFMERVILLRALSWCYMAYYEYTGGSRALTNSATFRKIVSYLDEAECFLQ